MSRLNDLIRQVALASEALAADLQREMSALADRRSFGLNFERHIPETVELPGRPVRRGDKVRVLPPRGQTPTAAEEKLWQVDRIDRSGEKPVAELAGLADTSETATAAIQELVVVAEFRDPIYPGLVSTGKVERGGDKPYHTVINAENYHALQALLFTHRGKVDAIYIDPPYNSGARDWKYNNDFIDADDLYRHSKWLAFIERRLLLAKTLLNPEDSVLIITIDEKEYLRLGLLLEQTFPEANIQMVSSFINPAGASRTGAFGRSDEYLFFVMLGDAAPLRLPLTREWVSVKGRTHTGTARWDLLRRSGQSASRSDRPGCFYPIYVEPTIPRIVKVGEALPEGDSSPELIEGTVAILPIRKNGTEGRWMMAPGELRSRIAQGRVRISARPNGNCVLYYLADGEYLKIQSGEYTVEGNAADGSMIISESEDAGETVVARPTTQWHISSHDSTQYGSRLLGLLMPDRKFSYPKSLYAVEDALRFFVTSKPSAVILDFFAGSGTTAHAVMRLNRQDDGRRQCILVTNNEVSADEQAALRRQGLRPGDPEWEKWGISDYITKPRLRAAVTGRTSDDRPVRGDYKFTDEFPMADGFEENVAFFSLTYEAPLRIASDRDFERIAPLLWLRAGSRGRRINDMRKGWDVAEAYGVLADLDQVEPFLKAVAEHGELEIVFIVTDEDRLFESVVRELPEHVKPVRLYEAYLRNFEIESGRGLR